MLVQAHQHENVRLARLRSYGILDTPREFRFDRLVFMAAQIAKTPIALITFVDSDRQWFKAQVGISIRETPRSDAFCALAILQAGPFIVEDTRQDPRFAENPLVTSAPFIRFYAGIPLFSEDRLPLGSLCVIDKQSRRLTTEQLRVSWPWRARRRNSSIPWTPKCRLSNAPAPPPDRHNEMHRHNTKLS